MGGRTLSWEYRGRHGSTDFVAGVRNTGFNINLQGNIRFGDEYLLDQPDIPIEWEIYHASREYGRSCARAKSVLVPLLRGRH